jgi:uroporphyrinogen decarboxylase
MTPKLAAEVTLQPITRFGFDAAILFSDILVIPAALGMTVIFEDGVGPSMAPITSGAGLSFDATSLSPVYEALELVRAALPRETALLGFAGAPWTLATYMAAGKGGDEQKAAKLWGYRDPERFGRLLDLLADCVATHLARQIEAGADAVQIFDSWASGLPEAMFERWVIAPTKKIVTQLRTIHPKALVIGFPRAATLAGYERYVEATGVDAVSLDTAAPMAWAARTLPVAIQGNLDPIALIAGGRALDGAADRILEATAGKPHVFNLGHGILPETPIAHVEQMLKRVRG